VQSFHICLYRLNGHFNQLHTFYIELTPIHRPDKEIENQCFSLSCVLETTSYDELILPLFYRMSNLEKLDVYLSIFVLEKFIDGNNLKKNILNRMSQLNQFSFHIRSYITNHFPGGLYPYVRVVSLYDEYPFEHEFLNHFHLWKT
ncbi:unnamed protein product, partial [Rotaria sp. Silwood2]